MDTHDLLIDNFTHSLSKTCARITNPEKDETAHDGIIFFIDEADSACPYLNIEYFFKYVTEMLLKKGFNN